MRFLNLCFRWFVVLVLVSPCTNVAMAQPDDVDFSGLYERIFQIRVVSKQADGKSSIGSGFQVSSDGHIITNYHVVSEFVTSPEHYDIHYATQDGKSGPLTLLDFDIVSDIAVLQHPTASKEFFALAATTPEKGEISYAFALVAVPIAFSLSTTMLEEEHEKWTSRATVQRINQPPLLLLRTPVSIETHIKNTDTLFATLHAQLSASDVHKLDPDVAPHEDMDPVKITEIVDPRL